MAHRTARGVLLVLAVALLGLAGAGVAPAEVAAAAPSPVVVCEAPSGRADDRIAVVVSFPGKPLRTACVAAGGNGIDVLRRAGFDPTVHGFGSVGGAQAVCALRDPMDRAQTGCAAGPDCLLCSEPDYWGYFPGYGYATASASLSTPRPGRVEAWVFGRSRSWPGSRPQSADICEVTPPPTTAPPATTAPPTPTTAAPPGGGTPRPVDPAPGRPGGAAPTPDPAAPTTAPPERPGTSTTTTTMPTTTTEAEAPPVVAGEGGSGGDGPTIEAAGPTPDGTGGGPVAVVDGGSGGNAMVPIAATGGVVALLGVLALRARRRRPELIGENPAAAGGGQG